MTQPSWLEPAMRSMLAAHSAGRMPHALLIHESPGVGGDWLADWAARLVLCERTAQAPCGTCGACRRALSGQHPDVSAVRPLEESQQLRIEQVRELAAELALTSHQGGYKVGILSPADSLNRFAANALLKTLEEPPPRTLLILVASEPSRLPATIMSRCQRIQLRAPPRAESIAWLRETCGEGDWNAVLDVLGEAPMSASQADAKAIPQVGSETRRALEDLARGAADPVSLAERWSRSELPVRLRCFENWITNRIRIEAGVSHTSDEIRGSAPLSRGAATPKLRGLFELMDGVRELKIALDSPLNKSMALEGLLRRLTPAAKH